MLKKNTMNPCKDKYEDNYFSICKCFMKCESKSVFFLFEGAIKKHHVKCIKV